MATDSLDPSGLGAHMLTLAAALAGQFDIVVAAPRQGAGGALLSRAAAAGFGVLALDLERPDDFCIWLARNADLCHVHAGIGWEGLALADAARRSGMPVVRTEHLPFVLTDPVQIAAYRKGLESVDRVITVSAASAASYTKAGFDRMKFAIVQNGIDPPKPTRSRQVVRKELGLREDDIAVLVVARLTAQKGHRTLIEAVPAVRSAQPGIRVLLVGDGPDRAEIADSADRAGLNEVVRFLGQRDDVPDLMAAADLFVLPSEFEGLPLVLLEAMAAELPIVATAIGGSDEALGSDHPYRVPPRDAAALAAAILKLVGDRPAAAAAAAGALRRFETRFRASRMADETAAIYAPLLARSDRDREETRAMTRTRIGFIGAGGIADRHLGVLEQFEDVALVAFADPDFARAEIAAQRFGARAFADPLPMLENVELDAVYICVPPFAHGPVEQAVIARGLPFFVEKPVSLDLAVAEEIERAASAAGLITAVGYHWRYLDTVEEARRILADNPARLVSGYWLDQTPPPQWWWKADRSGGQMVEQTTHILDLARYLVGDVDQVFGLAGHSPREAFPGLDVPTASTASLRFRSGAIGTISSTCLLRWGHRIGLNLFGDGLAIELTDHDLMVDVGAGRPTRQAEGDPVWREDRDFVDAVRGGENRIRCPYPEALATHRIALAIARSAETGQSVAL